MPTQIGERWLPDFLSEMLAVEIGGVKLYEKTLSELEPSEFEDKLTEFLHQNGIPHRGVHPDAHRGRR